jgi:hypothetical protein
MGRTARTRLRKLSGNMKLSHSHIECSRGDQAQLDRAKDATFPLLCVVPPLHISLMIPPVENGKMRLLTCNERHAKNLKKTFKKETNIRKMFCMQKVAEAKVKKKRIPNWKDNLSRKQTNEQTNMNKKQQRLQ